jgi:hypothetical protein
VQLRSLDSSQVIFLPVDPVGGWSELYFDPGKSLSFWPGARDCLCKWHPERCETYHLRKAPLMATAEGDSKLTAARKAQATKSRT